MSLGKIFLKLPLKTQIYFALFLLTIICFFLMFIFILILTNELISSKKQNRKKYFYDLQYKIHSTNIFFQNICILQYEQLLKLLNVQVYYAIPTMSFFTSNKKPTSTTTTKKTNQEYNSSTYEEELEKDKWGNYTMLYYHCYGNKTLFKYLFSMLDESVTIISRNTQSVRILYYGDNVNIVKKYLFFLYRLSGYFSFDIKAVKHFNDSIDDSYVDKYVAQSIKIYRYSYKIYFEKFTRGELHFFEYMFSNIYNIFENYNNKTLIEQKYSNSLESYIDEMGYYFIYFDYGTNQMILVNDGNPNVTRVLTQTGLIDNYLEFAYNLLMRIEEIDVIPLYKDNNTILSKKLCINFILKQLYYLKTEKFKNSIESGDEIFEILDEITTHLKIGISTIDDCFISNYIDILKKKFGNKYNDYIESDIKEIFIYDFENFYDLNFTESIMYFKMLNSDFGKYFFGVKYQFPNYNSLVNFEPSYFSLSQFNLYAFVTFFPVYKYLERSTDILQKCFYGIILLLIYLWLICSVILFCIAGKVINDLTIPIIHLQSLIDGTFSLTEDNKEKNINYDVDENISNLYILIKNLLNNTKFDVQKFGNSGDENNYENEEKSNIKNYNNNLIINQELIEQNQDKQNDEQKIVNKCIAVYRDYGIENKNQRQKKSFSKKKVCLENNCDDEDKNYLYRELMKVVECVEKPPQNSVKDYRKIYRTKKSAENEDLNDSINLDENESKNTKNTKNKNKFNKRKLHQNKKNILFHWYMENKEQMENKWFDVEKEKMQFCKTHYNFN